jgi:predicted enzyme related to lactoylglutathione lyase
MNQSFFIALKQVTVFFLLMLFVYCSTYPQNQKPNYMLGDKTIIAFVATTDKSKAIPFYENILGLKVTSIEPYAIVFDANGIQLRMSMTKELKPVQYAVLSWIVPDIKKTITELSRKGVKFEKYDWFKQDEFGIWTAPDETKVAWFKDPDGNILGLTEFKKKKN